MSDDRRPGEASITIAGAGLRGFGQLTREVGPALLSATHVYYSGFNGDPRPLLSDKNPQALIENLDAGEYGVGAYRPAMYERLAAKVLDAATATAEVLLLQPGSAVVVDTVTTLVLAGAAQRGLVVRVLPGISSIETVLTQLRYDAAAGLQVVLAQHLVLRRRRLDPTVAALVLQPGYYDTRWWGGAARSRHERFIALQRRLAASYGLETSMALVLSPTATADGSVLWFRLADLPRLHPVLSPFHTLFVPPTAEPPAIDEQFEQRVESWEHTLAALELDANGAPVEEGPEYWFAAAAAALPDDIRTRSEELAARWPILQRGCEPAA